MYAKKSLGQHFLKSERALTKIVEAGEISPGETVLEIGPGTGTLTEKLLKTGVKVIAVEKDDNLFEFLKNKFQSQNLELVHDDILNFDTALIDVRYKVVANIPYNLTGIILEKFLSTENQPERMVLLVQKEVAERIVAGRLPTGRQGKESILSISVKAYGEPKYIEKVLAGSFTPAPQVDSAIISIANISKKFFSDFSEKFFFTLLKAGFKSKRKKLSSNLSTLASKEKTLEIFEKLGLDPNLRAENVSVELWRELATLFG
ncbi:MAG: ribosomal RNA small subunit methyltransferase A [Candidatus Zambryskibacteria bacterium RIFCSPLOWO2_02_FULL_51_21]|uniref:Ribosomal RNA small subunit methyltransferase A n=1 Tax=Candidatus Zambryskibacteria bacterium RIFCSPHIGHO2_02_FULL_43_37 TaxID=1802749 RepID=A0A1G2TGF1_9BACT|nr:MAG: ribosomal RNA small subunit methyltransferase A [Candidatus Zambryskibacteria bacterium RIFCSPHIGHO2_01_FULL_52_18]OHA96360.1 MAG: ribosomal RNA small subunit methyltransferase A [Candidatus Zambryskibacteria bacterium RIFCSPHIGHO2_02_FULL_43_37]OHB07761.1 MAG: ribosomal RNA small subunit methyltransferase A [Candidatus Zambryskibacteria bacterium RIFCSPLOWO2_01_FULL_52_12]OHB11381.1 MAG: ribosomal RNA small subunit methyltransferase A [Candidatus Zambryskibacteria bacterium RIFCSPLOWO2_